MTPLTLAVYTKDCDMVAQLLRKGESIDLPVFYGYTPLMLAAGEGEADMCSVFLSYGADINAKDDHGRTPLMHAIRQGKSNICRLLLTNGVDVNVTDNDQRTALHHAVLYDEHSITSETFVHSMTSLLLEHEAMIRDPLKLWSEVKNSSSGSTKECRRRCKLKLFLNILEQACDLAPVLEGLYNVAVDYHSQQCAISVLRKGYYPIRKPDGFQLRSSYAVNSALYNGHVKLTSLLIELDPHLMQTEWLMDKQYLRRIADYPRFISWLEEYRKQPPSLAKLCRVTIRAHLAPYYTPMIKMLPLPKALKTFLTTLDSPYLYN